MLMNVNFARIHLLFPSLQHFPIISIVIRILSIDSSTGSCIRFCTFHCINMQENFTGVAKHDNAYDAIARASFNFGPEYLWVLRYLVTKGTFLCPYVTQNSAILIFTNFRCFALKLEERPIFARCLVICVRTN